MKTMNNNNNIESKKNVNNVVANNEVVYECLTVNGVTRNYPVAQPVGERVGWIKDTPGFANLGVAVNEPRGWRLNHTIYFDFAFNAYIKSRMSLEELVRITASGFGVKHDDTSVWARDLRTVLGDYIEHFDEYLEDADYFNDESEMGDPSKLNEFLTGNIFDGIILHGDLYDLAEDIKPHTAEEKAEYNKEESAHIKALNERITELEKLDKQAI